MEEKLKSLPKQLSNAFSTGGGGYNFERHVQAVFLLMLINNGIAPGIHNQISKLHFQGRRLGYHIDDLIVESTGKPQAGKLLCQIKHSIAITKTDKGFQEVITAAWNDFIDEKFNKSADRIALITGMLAKDSMDALRELHDQALAADSAGDFLTRIEQRRAISENLRTKFEVLKHCLSNAKGVELTESELHDFCKVFLLIIFDGVFEGSINEALCQTLIKGKSEQDPETVWRALADYAGDCSQNSSSITKETLAPSILDLFGIEPKGVTHLPVEISSPEKMAKLAIIGAWNENNAADQKAIETITGAPYHSLLEYAREQLNVEGSPVSLNNGIWQVSNRKEILLQVNHYIFDDLVKSAFSVAEGVVLEESKQFSADGARYYYTPPGGWFANSPLFRKRLCEGLCILVNGTPFKHVSAHLIDHQAHQLVKKLFESFSWKTIASVGDLLPILAELSPDTFLDEIERLTALREDALKKLFPQKTQQSLLDPNYITQILWSLEKLAWIPAYFSKSVRCLGCLEMIGYEETNHANTPRNSISSIMNVFQPQTFASVKQMKNAILALKTDSPELCWNVLLGLIPKSTTIIYSTSKPKYIDLSPFSGNLTKQERQELLDYYQAIALQLSHDSAQRLSVLAGYTWNMSQKQLREYLATVQGCSPTWKDNQKYIVWDSLQSLRVRILFKSDKKKPEAEVFKLLEDAIAQTMPGQKLYQYLRLYTKGAHESLLEETGSRWRIHEADKVNAIFDIYSTDGIDSVIQFGQQAGNLQDVGRKLGTKLGLSDFDEILKKYEKEPDSEFFCAVVGGFLSTNGAAVLSELELGMYNTDFKAKVLLAAPPSPDIFAIVGKYLPDKALYWKQVPFTWFPSNWTQDDVDTAIHELMDVGRFVSIIRALEFAIKDFYVPDALLIEILLGAASEKTTEKIDADAVCDIIQKLQDAKEPDMESLAQVEYIYLPLLNQSSEVFPKALFFKLSNESRFFCELIELAYKPRHGEHRQGNLPEEVVQRLYPLIYDFRVVPGVDWDGNFSAERFQTWIKETVAWANEVDRFVVVQHTIGKGLSFAEKDNGLPNTAILEELNKQQNEEMRHGYILGIENQRGAHWVDPEGKPERKLAEQFAQYATRAEELGFSRVAEMFVKVSQDYIREAEENVMEQQALSDEETE